MISVKRQHLCWCTDVIYNQESAQCCSANFLDSVCYCPVWLPICLFCFMQTERLLSEIGLGPDAKISVCGHVCAKAKMCICFLFLHFKAVHTNGYFINLNHETVCICNNLMKDCRKSLKLVISHHWERTETVISEDGENKIWFIW